MVKVRNTLIKMCSLVFAVCAAFAIATMPSAKTASAAEEASFKANESSILVYDGEDEGKIGLRFEAEFNTAWLNANTADKYTFGMVVAPTANFTAWDGEATPTANMEAVDGVNIIRIQNTALTAGATFGASILFDDASLKATIAEKLEIEVSEVTDEQLGALKEEVYVQSYSAVPYATYGEEIVYLNRVDASMRETAIDMLAVAVNEEDYEAMAFAFNYIGINEDDMFLEQAYVVNNVLTVDSSDDFVIEESDVIMAGGKVLALGVDYTIENGVATFTALDKSLEGICVLRDTSLIAVSTTFADAALATADDVVDFFMNKDNFVYSEANKAHYNTKTAVLANDIDLEGVIFHNYTQVYFSGTFDGRGHVLSNVTVQTIDLDAKKNSTYGLFGSIQEGGIIKNVAFSDAKTVDHQANGAVIGYSFAGLMENVYLSYSVDNQSKSGMFVVAEKGTMRNVVVVDNYYDPNFDVDDYIVENNSAWGVSPIVRSMSEKSSTFENVQVISRKPLSYVSNGSNVFEVTYSDPVEDNPETADKDETAPAKMNWGARFAYAENETDVWYDFEYFYREVGETEYGFPTGLGLEAGTANVENTLETPKTIRYSGIRRYDDMAAFMADQANNSNKDSLLNSGFFKVVDDELVWANDENISAPCLFVNEVEYDASTGILYTTAWNGEKINKITLGGVVLTTEENGGLVVDGEDNIVGIRAKVNASDEIIGIDYINNFEGKKNVINYNGAIRVYTDNQVYAIRNIKYYTQLIFDATDLKEAVGYKVDYSIADLGAADSETDREKTLNGKGYFVGTTKDGSKYYEGVYNVGIYKMMADVDMEKAGIGYVNNPLNMGNRIGGFGGYFDGNGYTIDNYKADQQGLFGRMSNNITGNEVNTGRASRSFSYPATVKNLALTNVITTYWDETLQQETPILAITAGSDAYCSSYGKTTIENIYATVSTESTALGNFITMVGASAKINNLYLVNTNEFGMEAQDNSKFKLTDDPARASATIASGTKIYNLFTNYGSSVKNLEGVLFGHAYTNVSNAPAQSWDGLQEALDSITNTHVVTTMPISYFTYGTPFAYTYSDSYIGVKFTADGAALPKADFYKFGQVSKTSGKAFIAIAYAANETVGNIPVMYGIKQSAIDDAKAIYAAGGSVGNSTSITSFMCDTCGEIAFTGSAKAPAAGKACASTTDCTGTYVNCANYQVPGGKGQLATPCIFTFTYHTAADMAEYYSASNGAWKLKNVKKYADAQAMKAANNDYSSFTGETGNGLWKVVEGELIWVGRIA